MKKTLRPRNLSADQWTFNPGPLLDVAPPGRNFGEVLVEPNERYRRGDEVTAVFLTGNPRLDVRADGTFLEIQHLDGQGVWQTVATDDDWSTTFRIEREWLVFKHARITWRIPEDAAPGSYRILHHGAAKSGGGIASFQGRTRQFSIE